MHQWENVYSKIMEIYNDNTIKKELFLVKSSRQELDKK